MRARNCGCSADRTSISSPRAKHRREEQEFHQHGDDQDREAGARRVDREFKNLRRDSCSRRGGLALRLPYRVFLRRPGSRLLCGRAHVRWRCVIAAAETAVEVGQVAETGVIGDRGDATFPRTGNWSASGVHDKPMGQHESENDISSLSNSLRTYLSDTPCWRARAPTVRSGRPI